MKPNYYTNEKIEALKEIFDSAFNKKAEYENIWRQIAEYTGLNKEFYNQQQNDKKQDTEINNSQAVISLNQSSDSMLGILIGDGNFFRLKVKDKIEDMLKNQTIQITNRETNQVVEKEVKVNVSKLQEYVEFVSFLLKQQFFYKESNFTKTLHKTIKEYFAFGNAGMGVFLNENNNDNINWGESRLKFVNYSVNNCAFLEGKNGDIESIFLKYEWTAKRIVETFCFEEDGIINEQKFNKLPDKIKENYNSKKNTKNYQINYIFMRNPEKKQNIKEGAYSANYVGLFVDFESNCVIDCQYYKNKQFKIIRDNIITGEIYGRGLAGNILSEIELLNKITGDSIENIENTIRPYLFTYENVVAKNKLELDRNKLTILRPTQNNPNNNPPIAPLIPAGDITATIQFLIPELQKNISTGLKSDVFLDFNSRSNMTATETQVRNNIRNKVLFANALDFQNLLNCLIYNSYYILCRDNFDDKKDDVIKFLEYNYIDWFDIEYTSELAQISKNSEIQSTMNFIQSLAFITQMAPQEKQAEIIKRIDFSRVSETLATLYNKSELLFSQEDFEKMMQQEQMALQQQSQAIQQQNEADLLNKQANSMKTMAEANNLQNGKNDNMLNNFGI